MEYRSLMLDYIVCACSLEGAKRFGRCKGVDVIYLKRKE